MTITNFKGEKKKKKKRERKKVGCAKPDSFCPYMPPPWKGDAQTIQTLL